MTRLVRQFLVTIDEPLVSHPIHDVDAAKMLATIIRDEIGHGNDVVVGVEPACARCDTCANWKVEDFEQISETPHKFRRCSKPPMLWDATEWRDNDATGEIDRFMKPGYIDARMFVQDGSDYRAVLVTRADFSCAEFSRKPG